MLDFVWRRFRFHDHLRSQWSVAMRLHRFDYAAEIPISASSGLRPFRYLLGWSRFARAVSRRLSRTGIIFAKRRHTLSYQFSPAPSPLLDSHSPSVISSSLYWILIFLRQHRLQDRCQLALFCIVCIASGDFFAHISLSETGKET